MCSDEAPICFTAAAVLSSVSRALSFCCEQPVSRYRRERHAPLQLGK